MTDIEITLLCAEVEGRANADALTDADVAWIIKRFTQYGIVTTNAQAMALVKRFELEISRGWRVFTDDFVVHNKDLNIAICEFFSGYDFSQ